MDVCGPTQARRAIERAVAAGMGDNIRPLCGSCRLTAPSARRTSVTVLPSRTRVVIAVMSSLSDSHRGMAASSGSVCAAREMTCSDRTSSRSSFGGHPHKHLEADEDRQPFVQLAAQDMQAQLERAFGHPVAPSHSDQRLRGARDEEWYCTIFQPSALWASTDVATPSRSITRPSVSSIR